jgi:hypothetical protein
MGEGILEKDIKLKARFKEIQSQHFCLQNTTSCP